MTNDKLNGRADQEKERHIEKRKVQRNAQRVFSARFQGHGIVGCQVCFLIEK